MDLVGETTLLRGNRTHVLGESSLCLSLLCDAIRAAVSKLLSCMLVVFLLEDLLTIIKFLDFLDEVVSKESLESKLSPRSL